ncbi:glycosyltransferase family 4 protein [Myxococcota bacterium]|nr:glycosyltransferase family 4 protein [Myxococcota bacterium]
MTIVHVPRRFTRSHWGGTESVVLEVATRQQRQGHRVAIWCPEALADRREETIEGVEVRRFPYFYPFLGLSPEQRHAMDLKGGNLVSFSLMAALLQTPQLDVLHLHTGNRLGGIVRTVAAIRRIPYFVTIHGGVEDIPASEQESYREARRGTLEWGKILGWALGSHRVLQDAAGVLVLGRREEEVLRRRDPRVRVHRFSNGVDPARFQGGDGQAFRERYGIPRGARVLLQVGRIDPQKAQRTSLQVLEQLLPRFRDLHLLLIGPVTHEAYAAQVREEVERSGGHATLVPGLPAGTSDLRDAYAAAEILLLPSVHEPFGIVILEGWAAGLPVVACGVGGVPDVIRHDRDGLLVEPGNLGAFRDAVATLLQDPDRGRAMGSRGRERVRSEFHWDRVVDRLMGLYGEALITTAPKGGRGSSGRSA